MLESNYEVGTLLDDMGKLGVISRLIKSGSLDVEMPLIKWRVNYEVYYQDGIISIIGHETLNRLIEEKKVRILHQPRGTDV
tara:strand:- start:201 stop:443 length:243 start_codon:yes stop_codon:yes gene_type:complete